MQIDMSLSVRSLVKARPLAEIRSLAVRHPGDYFNEALVVGRVNQS